jgi:hypothetical protein
MCDLYLGDKPENDILGWLIANVAPLGNTLKAEWNYYNTYRAKKDVWVMNTSDVSDVNSSQWDTITHIIFKNREDAVLCKLTWGGTIYDNV